ncbi:haloacid dehalogenase-like hydrolase family member protein [Theileria equi strain WA]|uniref:Haloacid dehalogenase-like hydrolase family member protein n=1 Tax=Theileria equi strain WA TaxID=1537102 RepID=L0AVX3_THEEQ|nr:haloacid dehalogenase-like hydrolase family member protein [Theileria equi strain WA]AFZ79752.1 haloacid dehalogenase-like hydrolase family member protein [Theileria equi strain WA]|eukprot:XP_004829418.1 haloacid dehalogenase-like hydrolase family member protein [Theileria equi strain WA]
MESDSTSITETPSFVKPEEPPKYFGIDIDGTFYTGNEEAWEKNVEAFAEVRKKGYTPFFCTSRSLDSTLSLVGNDFVKKTGYNGCPGVYENGVFVYGDKDALYMNVLSRHFLNDFIRFLPEDSLNRVIFFQRDDSYSLVDTDPWIKTILKGNELPATQVKTLDEILNLDIIKIMIYSDPSLLVNLRKNVGFNAFMLHNNLFMISPLDLNKSLGINQLMENYGISPKDCGFIGDGHNDIEAMKFCNVSFAVANAPDEVKKHAKIVLDKTCDQGAVAEALKLTYGL